MREKRGGGIKNFFEWGVLLVILLALIGVRGEGLTRQMTHVDDIGVAWASIIQPEKTYSIEYIREKINDTTHVDYHAPQMKLMRFIDERGWVERGLPTLREGMKFFAVPQMFTYGPLQFFISVPLLDMVSGYRATLFAGRFLPFLFSIASVFLLFVAGRKAGVRASFPFFVWSALSVGFSLSAILYARHMSSYAIGLCASTALFWIFFRAIDGQTRMKRKEDIGTALALTLVGMAHYQTLYFFPAFFAAWGIFAYIKVRSWRGFIRPAFVGILFFIFFLPTLITYVLPNAYLNGAAFQGTEYDFSLSGKGIGESARYSVEFFSRHFFSATEFITAFVPYGTAGLHYFTFGILFMAISGVFLMLRERENNLCAGGIFILVAFLSLIGLVLAGKFHITPTRHMLVFLPFLVFPSAYAFSRAMEWMRGRFGEYSPRVGMLCVSALVLIPFFTHFHSFTSSRRDLYNEKELVRLIQEYKPEAVVTKDTNLFFMETFARWDASHGGVLTFNTFKNPQGEKGIFLLLSPFPIDEEACTAMIRETYPSRECSVSTRVEYRADITTGATLDVSSREHQIWNALHFLVVKSVAEE